MSFISKMQEGPQMAQEQSNLEKIGAKIFDLYSELAYLTTFIRPLQELLPIYREQLNHLAGLEGLTTCPICKQEHFDVRASIQTLRGKISEIEQKIDPAISLRAKKYAAILSLKGDAYQAPSLQ